MQHDGGGGGGAADYDFEVGDLSLVGAYLDHAAATGRLVHEAVHKADLGPSLGIGDHLWWAEELADYAMTLDVAKEAFGHLEALAAAAAESVRMAQWLYLQADQTATASFDDKASAVPSHTLR